MLDVQGLLHPQAKAASGEQVFDFSGEDFCGFSVQQQASLCWKATPEHGVVRIIVSVTAPLSAECSRCLSDACYTLRIDKEYVLRQQDLQNPFPELPLTPDGMLDLRELAYGEIVMESPQAILCDEDCAGLCAQCGKSKTVCKCTQEPECDPRLQVLRDLLTAQDDEGQ